MISTSGQSRRYRTPEDLSANQETLLNAFFHSRYSITFLEALLKLQNQTPEIRDKLIDYYAAKYIRLLSTHAKSNLTTAGEPSPLDLLMRNHDNEQDYLNRSLAAANVQLRKSDDTDAFWAFFKDYLQHSLAHPYKPSLLVMAYINLLVAASNFNFSRLTTHRAEYFPILKYLSKFNETARLDYEAALPKNQVARARQTLYEFQAAHIGFQATWERFKTNFSDSKTLLAFLLLLSSMLALPLLLLLMYYIYRSPPRNPEQVSRYGLSALTLLGLLGAGSSIASFYSAVNASNAARYFNQFLLLYGFKPQLYIDKQGENRRLVPVHTITPQLASLTPLSYSRPAMSPSENKPDAANAPAHPPQPRRRQHTPQSAAPTAPKYDTREFIKIGDRNYTSADADVVQIKSELKTYGIFNAALVKPHLPLAHQKAFARVFHNAAGRGIAAKDSKGNCIKYTNPIHYGAALYEVKIKCRETGARVLAHALSLDQNPARTPGTTWYLFDRFVSSKTAHR